MVLHAALPRRTHTAALADSERHVPYPYLLATGLVDPQGGHIWPAHHHEEHELLWSERGTATMRLAGRQWTIAPGAGLWVPAGMVHEGEAEDFAAIRTTYFSPETWAKPWRHPATVAVHPLLRQLLVHLKRARMAEGERLRAQQVCIDMLAMTEDTQLDVPLPRDERLAPLIDEVLRDPADDRSLEQWAVLLNMTTRTVARAFAADVGMSFSNWRRLVRMREAQGLLATGSSVKTVARSVGYSSTSAFVSAFRRSVGQTPGAIAERPGPPVALSA